MIRLVHVLTSFDIGGAEQLVLDIARRLDRKQYDVRVIAVVRGGPLRAEFHEAGIPTDVVGKRTKLGFEAIQHLVRDFRSPTPDIVHTHLFGGDTWGRIAAIRAGVPHIVSTEHNVNLDEGPLKRLVKRHLARKTDRIIAVSDAVRSYSVRMDRVPLGKMVVIQNGVDTARFRPVPATPHDDVRFVSVGRLVEQKGHDVLLEAFLLLRDTHPRARLEIIGDGPRRAELEALCASFHLTDRVRFLGLQRDIPAYYQRSDILVLPSRWEGFGIAAIEASACGIPVIASSVGGLQEAVVDGETGILVPPEDPKALATAMRALAADRPRRVLMGHAGRRHVERSFSIDRVVQRHEELYAALMAHTR
ncbi:MAG: glycosyltransferase [bacterium]|nr:glycosyltransferase [bacterium]